MCVLYTNIVYGNFVHLWKLDKVHFKYCATGMKRINYMARNNDTHCEWCMIIQRFTPALHPQHQARHRSNVAPEAVEPIKYCHMSGNKKLHYHGGDAGDTHARHGPRYLGTPAGDWTASFPSIKQSPDHKKMRFVVDTVLLLWDTVISSLIVDISHGTRCCHCFLTLCVADRLIPSIGKK